MGLAISLLAALGIGSIVAASISRWNAISQLRQAWVDSLRSEIASFFNAIEKVSEALNGSAEARLDLRPRRDHTMFVYRQILLRLNLREQSHRELNRSLKELLTIGQGIDLVRVDRALMLSRRVLKAEWQRTKFGPLLKIVKSSKARSRRRHLGRLFKNRNKRLALGSAVL